MAKEPSEAASYYGDYNCDLPPWTLDKACVGFDWTELQDGDAGLTSVGTLSFQY